MKALSVESACGPVERVCGAKGQRTTSSPLTSWSGGSGEHQLEMGKASSLWTSGAPKSKALRSGAGPAAEALRGLTCCFNRPAGHIRYRADLEFSR